MVGNSPGAASCSTSDTSRTLPFCINVALSNPARGTAAHSNQEQTRDQPAQSPRPSLNCSPASHWILRCTIVALKGQIPKYPVSCSLLHHLSPVPVSSLLQAPKARGFHLLQHMAGRAIRAIETVFPNIPA